MAEERPDPDPPGPQEGEDSDERKGAQFGDGMDLWRHGQPVCGGLLKKTQHQQDHGGKEVQSVKPFGVHQ